MPGDSATILSQPAPTPDSASKIQERHSNQESSDGHPPESSIEHPESSIQTPPSALRNPNSDWSSLLQEALTFAHSQVDRYRWRGELGGVLPDGFDAESIAAESIASLWQELRSGVPIPNPQRHLYRLVHRHIDRLHRRMENYLMRNEPDLAPVWLDDGEAVSIIETLPDPGPTPRDHLLSAEAAAQFDQLKQRVTNLLDRDRPLKNMFLCLCDDISKPRDLASHLKIPVTRVQPLQRRLRRRLSPFFRPTAK